ncbi:rod shape-determining protein RodA [Oligella ureolytica]|uniref:rod shape-determining protein RodA n=1 Tax=Oligella ureolytica TaxID=90244 RepID=UPI0015F0B63C|nr:rod shape-determining protein RodA [Oligella ureolytica]
MTKLMSQMLRSLRCFDWPLLLILLAFFGLSMLVMHSAVGSTDYRFAGQLRNFSIAFFAMWIVAMIKPPVLMRLSVPIYIVGLILLVGVEFFGITQKGATRWLNLGVATIQPSEMMKLAMPLMLAWYFDRYRNSLSLMDFMVAIILLMVPFALIIKQPDLGTALLVLASGLVVIYFAGLSFKLIVPVFVLGVSGLTLLIAYQNELCQPGFDWVILHEYQKSRVCTLMDPTTDPLGKGFHTIQAMIAIGSGGVYGKGYMQGTQTHLDFIPERTTDFIFAVYAEEFGLYGCILLLALYTLFLGRGFMIALKAKTQFGRLLAGAITMTFFVYIFVNIGMVMGILPVVGVPLPFMSYGGTALVTLGVACGMLMSISNYVPSVADQRQYLER